MHVVQDAENEITEQGRALANTLQVKHENTMSELSSLRNSVTAAAADNQRVLGKHKEIERARVQLRDGVVVLAQDLDKVKTDKDGVLKSVVTLKDECSTATSRVVDCQQEIHNAS